MTLQIIRTFDLLNILSLEAHLKLLAFLSFKEQEEGFIRRTEAPCILDIGLKRLTESTIKYYQISEQVFNPTIPSIGYWKKLIDEEILCAL
jgi:hypothetical protein